MQNYTFSPHHDWALIQSTAELFVYLEGPFAQSPRPINGPCLYLNDYWLGQQTPYHIPAKALFIKRAELEAALAPATQALSSIWNEAQITTFAEDFQEIQKLIAAGKLQKAVPFYTESGHLKADTQDFPRSALQHLLFHTQGYPLYVFCISLQGKVQIGASPEILFHQEGSVLKSMALAGTRPKTRRDELLSSAKEAHEHSLVVDDLRERLSPYGYLEAGTSEILDLPTLSHLHTPILLKNCQERDFDFWVKHLHPTPALGCAPREAPEWRELHQKKYPQRQLGAPVGLIFNDIEKLCLVTLRYVEFDAASTPNLKIPAGCGIVQASKLEEEWQELFAKRQSVKRILGLE